MASNSVDGAHPDCPGRGPNSKLGSAKVWAPPGFVEFPEEVGARLAVKGESVLTTAIRSSFLGPVRRTLLEAGVLVMDAGKHNPVVPTPT